MQADIAKAIAVFDKSAERTKPNAQTEAWKVLRAELHRLLAIAEAVDGAEVADIATDGRNGGESALISAATRAGYYSGIPIRLVATK